jgi:hypothetical protein
MTGLSRRARRRPGVNTLRNRQFSDVLAWPNGDAGCGQCGANCVASRTPDQRGKGCGGRQRSAPTGGAAYGMPRNSSTAPLASPRTAPSLVPATGPPPPVCARIGLAPTAGPAATNQPRMTPAAAIHARVSHVVRVIGISSLLYTSTITSSALCDGTIAIGGSMIFGDDFVLNFISSAATTVKITGGTGVYRHARGTIVVKPVGDNNDLTIKVSS